MSSDYQLEDTIYLPFTTRAFATGIPTALVSGVVDIYEDVTATPIITAETLTVSLNSHAGFNMITVTATSASGFLAGKSYTAILDAGTVDSVSVIGEVVAHFTLDKSAAAKDLANGTDGLGAIKAETALIVADTNELQTDDIPGTIAALNDVAATDIVSAGAITTSSGAVSTVTTVGTTTTNTDMRGTDSAYTGTPPTATQNADELLKRDWTNVSGEAARSVLNALRQNRNRVTIVGSTITIYKEDGTTAAWTGTLTTSASAEAITEIAP